MVEPVARDRREFDVDREATVEEREPGDPDAGAVGADRHRARGQIGAAVGPRHLGTVDGRDEEADHDRGLLDDVEIDVELEGLAADEAIADMPLGQAAHPGDVREVPFGRLDDGLPLLRVAHHLPVVLVEHGGHVAVGGDVPTRQPDGAVARQLDGGRRVGHEDDRDPLAAELGDARHALVLEGGVADGHDLVEQEDVRVEVRGDREAEAGVHAARIGAHRSVDEVAELRELDDVLHPRLDLLAADPVDRGVEDDVLTA